MPISKILVSLIYMTCIFFLSIFGMNYKTVIILPVVVCNLFLKIFCRMKFWILFTSIYMYVMWLLRDSIQIWISFWQFILFYIISSWKLSELYLVFLCYSFVTRDNFELFVIIMILSVCYINISVNIEPLYRVINFKLIEIIIYLN